MKIEMCEQTNTTKFWAWSNRSYKSVDEFVQEYNNQAERFDAEKICERNALLLSVNSPIKIHKWIFKIV